jgi:hypothetical protein
MKKAIAFFASILLMMALTSCHAYMDISGQKEYEAWQDKSHTWVLHLKTNQDSTIDFLYSFPGKMSNGEVVVINLLKAQIKHGEADSIVFYNHRAVPRYFWKDGTRYKIVDQDHYYLTGVVSDTLRIPFSEIKQMNIKKIDTGKTVLLIIGSSIGGVGVWFGLIYLLILLTFSNMTMW